MDNFKEIAEKCLNGELSGTFVCRNGKIFKSLGLSYNSGLVTVYPYSVSGLGSYTSKGTVFHQDEDENDIIAFIPDNMKQDKKEIKIEVPEGYEIDKENSTFEKIVFKKIEDGYPKSWEELHPTVEGKVAYFIDNASEIRSYVISKYVDPNMDKHILPSMKLAEGILALTQLLSLRAAWIHQWSVDNGFSEDWKPDWSNCAFSPISVITRRISYDDPSIKYSIVNNIRSNAIPRMLSFPNAKLADEFLDTFKELIEQAKELI